MTAALAILNERDQPLKSQDKLDQNNYVLGGVHEHSVVIACLPAGVYGTNSVARVARDMLRTFTGLRFGLMVGIRGGVPNCRRVSTSAKVMLQSARLTKPMVESFSTTW